LEVAGHIAMETPNAVRALNALGDDAPGADDACDAVFLDLKLRNGDGPDVLARSLQNPPRQRREIRRLCKYRHRHGGDATSAPDPVLMLAVDGTHAVRHLAAERLAPPPDFPADFPAVSPSRSRRCSPRATTTCPRFTATWSRSASRGKSTTISCASSPSAIR